ncbi:MAG: riboflavin biosynthesis protein RibD [Deltaproteobacteria bacterium RIFCSPLOWO2_12_FULL_40_28]|nr:MAG: riboflavin biosynthesis protein RibD [Deltaproteobacteria bacterium RIFCSPHIGHO2_02_FULL_40_28]OGQ19642.1 MAG: riboflavin biosynthesis protein RibD [Deltaproteobacteria bacterium RIFCSPHIGHO2_12_FULL_40_32]OGQ40919.1 MAG: riboflavin biosynthesis protein RibD [Deltaproteobacteria bacterium RIFCSPLOWO2_02_FULL_40_36]OGQ54034.1 MAG: riboflavin biosynthesis protein RibD [Deltaproteobacteria bacterium RIFCSPLOWO2_12_FULL_40_28]
MNDNFFMERCLKLAARGAGFVSPNPMVGCVIVKNGKIIAEGYHQKFGQAHAEINALKKIKFQAKEATLYCNLEPCFHQGKTPPCVHQIINSGVARVVVGSLDANPQTAGKSLALFQKNKIQVTKNILKDECLELNRSFFKWIKLKLPYVVLKSAISLDGKITPAGKKTGWITGVKARERVQEIRAGCDALLVGIGTVLNDDPRLNVRNKKLKQPVRIILDTHLKISPKARIFSVKVGRIVLCTSKKSFLSLKAKALGKKATFLPVSLEGGYIKLPELLQKLGKMGISSLLVEGGAKVNTSFLAKGLVDEIIFHRSSQNQGPKALKMTTKPLKSLIKKRKWLLKSVQPLSSDDFELVYQK